MQNKRKAILLVAKVMAAFTLLALFSINMAAFTNKDTDTNSLAILSKVAYADGESGGGDVGNNVTCYSSSQDKVGSHFYDCGKCVKADNAIGTGTSSNCVVH